MLVYSLKSDLARPGDSILELLSGALARTHLRLRTHDVVAVSSKVVGISQQRIVSLQSIGATRDARILARRFSLTPSFAQIVLDESDEVIGGVKGTLLTIKNGDAVANAGVDRKNAPRDSVVLWPENADAVARKLRAQIKRRFGKDVGVVIVDSRVTPLRLGTTGFAIGSAGFQPVEDIRGTRDLSGRRVEITFHATADGIAAAAQLVMGEVSERRPFAIIRGAPVRIGNNAGIIRAKLASDQCLFMSQIIPGKPGRSWLPMKKRINPSGPAP
jgi:coenzyme F420-0:L-glutamate ligase / coenzyme F420-1:gamma-L-glutamate ligase